MTLAFLTFIAGVAFGSVYGGLVVFLAMTRRSPHWVDSRPEWGASYPKGPHSTETYVTDASWEEHA